MHPRSLLTALGAVALTGVVAVGAYWAGTHSASHGEPGNGTTPPPTPSTSSPPPGEDDMPPSIPAATPESAAIGWLVATNTLSWRDPTPTAWVDRVSPYVTGPAQHDAEQARGGQPGADWNRLLAHQCVQRVHEPGGVIPPEAPRTEQTAYVQVSGTAAWECAAGSPPPPQPLAATLEVVHFPDGTWRVSKHLF